MLPKFSQFSLVLSGWLVIFKQALPLELSFSLTGKLHEILFLQILPQPLRTHQARRMFG